MLIPVPNNVDRFEIAVDQALLDDVEHRLRRTRFPADVANDDWSYGVNVGYLQELVDYWLDSFD